MWRSRKIYFKDRQGRTTTSFVPSNVSQSISPVTTGNGQ